MRNEKVRFAIDDDGSLYDYKTGKNHQPTGFLVEDKDQFDLAEVKRCIESNEFTHSAHEPLIECGIFEPAPVAPVDPVVPPVVTDPAPPVLTVTASGSDALSNVGAEG